MLAKPPTRVSQVLDKFQDMEFACEYKYGFSDSLEYGVTSCYQTGLCIARCPVHLKIYYKLFPCEEHTMSFIVQVGVVSSSWNETCKGFDSLSPQQLNSNASSNSFTPAPNSLPIQLECYPKL